MFGEHVKVNNVCLTCRKSAKAKDGMPAPICPTCHIPMVNIGKHWRVPKRTDDKEWKKLKDRIDKALAKGLRPNYYL